MLRAWLALVVLLVASLPTGSSQLSPTDPALWEDIRLPSTDPRDHIPRELIFGERDDDGDGLGDAWQESWQDYVEQTLETLQDLDDDCLLNAGEFAWHTIPLGPIGPLFPNARDYDGDGLSDAEEVALWNDPSNDVADYFATACPSTSPRVRNALPFAAYDPDFEANFDDDAFTTTWDPDADNDGLLDGAEVKATTRWGFPSDPANADTDADTLTDAAETGDDGWGSDPNVRDSDRDALDDAAELLVWRSFGLDPRDDLDGDALPGLLDPDADGDGLGDGEESAYRANLSLRDTDADGMLDGWEAHHGLDPANAADADDDPDLDGLVNLAEHDRATHPYLADTDADALSDGDEVTTTGTDPAVADSDADGMPDGWEVGMGLDPKRANADEDPDADGWSAGGSYVAWTNGMEYRYLRPPTWDESAAGPWTGGTHPLRADTDEDGVSDGEEARAGTPATGAPVGVDVADADADGLLNADEFDRNLDPTNADSDGDGLCDGGFAAACRAPGVDPGAPGETNGYGSNPVPPNDDTDGDGLGDWDEAAMHESGGSADADGVAPILDADSDDDGLPDGFERAIGSDPLARDTDGDLLDDAEELTLGTDASVPDSDEDGIPDGAEVAAAVSDPLVPDSDFDGLVDGDETRSDPRVADTDGDELPDGWEVEFGLDPRNPADAVPDTDGDALTNRREYHHNADPGNVDTDGDTIPDGVEVALGLRPDRDDLKFVDDADQDGLYGYEEFLLGTDPWAFDSDSDGLGDYAEAFEGVDAPLPDPWATLGAPRFVATDLDAAHLDSDPSDADTDDDGIADGRERQLWLDLGGDALHTDHAPRSVEGRRVSDPTFFSNLRRADADADGLDDGDELLTLGTDPRIEDTDGDTYTDYDEAHRGSNPRDPLDIPAAGPRIALGVDTDRDGLEDWEEYGITLTDPENPDTDGDALDDAHELKAWRAKRNASVEDVRALLRNPDVDGDEVVDGEEFAFATLDRSRFFTTDPDDADSDGDGLLDGAEARNGATVQSFLVAQALAERATREPEQRANAMGLASTGGWMPPGASSVVALVGAYGTLIEVSTAFPDRAGDGSPRGPDGCDATGKPAADSTDSDGDGLADGEEAPYGAPRIADPCKEDSEGDGLDDAIEVRRLPPGDLDGDGVPSALDLDTDGDTLGDGVEDVSHNGFVDGGERSLVDRDTDDDGLADDAEDGPGQTRSTAADSDADGLPDGLELGIRAGVPPLAGGVVGGTEPRALLCGGRLIGSSFTPFEGGSINLGAMAADSDGDGLLDGFEDYNKNGIFGMTHYGEGDAGETLPGGEWPELNPSEHDSDGDGLLDAVEINGHRTLFTGDRPYCLTLRLLDFYSAMPLLPSFAPENMLGFATAHKTVTNPHDADTDDDGVLDATDVAPREAESLLTLDRLMYQQIEKVDAATEHQKYAPDMVMTIEIQVAGSSVRLQLPKLEDFYAKEPRSILDAVSELVPETTGEVVGRLDDGVYNLVLPQRVEAYQVQTDPSHFTLKISAVDMEFDPFWSAPMSEDVLALENSGSFEDDLPLILGMTESLNFKSQGTSGKGGGIADPKDGLVSGSFRPALDKFFLDRALSAPEVPT